MHFLLGQASKLSAARWSAMAAALGTLSLRPASQAVQLSVACLVWCHMQERGETFLFYSYAHISGGALLIGLCAGAVPGHRPTGGVPAACQSCAPHCCRHCAHLQRLSCGCPDNRPAGEAAVALEQRSAAEAAQRAMRVLRGIFEPRGAEVPAPLQVRARLAPYSSSMGPMPCTCLSVVGSWAAWVGQPAGARLCSCVWQGPPLPCGAGHDDSLGLRPLCLWLLLINAGAHPPALRWLQLASRAGYDGRERGCAMPQPATAPACGEPYRPDGWHSCCFVCRIDRRLAPAAAAITTRLQRASVGG